MMYLFRISMRYLREQKLRTALTWCCIALAVLMLSTVGVLGSSVYTLLCDTVVDQSGDCEVSVNMYQEDAVLDEEVLIHSNLVENGSVRYAPKQVVAWDSAQPTEDDQAALDQRYIASLSLNGTSFMLVDMSVEKLDAQAAKTYGSDLDSLTAGRYPENENEIVLSSSFCSPAAMLKQMLQDGKLSEDEALPFDDWEPIAIGDTVSFRYQEQLYTLNEEHPEVQALPEKERSVMNTMESFTFNRAIEQGLLVPVSSGEQLQKTYTVVGFVRPAYAADRVIFHPNDPLMDVYYAPSGVRLKLDQNLDFDETLEQLLEDAVISGSPREVEYSVNDTLLTLRFRGVDARAAWVQIGAALVIFVLIIVLVARLFIDNAFEMSTQERVRQFGMLRTIGATKGQIRAIVLFEALFYILTTIPVAMLTASGVCSSLLGRLGDVMKSIEDDLMIATPRFSFLPPVIIGTVAVCVLAILISSYTSAMWASRQAPVDALSFGRPKVSGSEQRMLDRRARSTAKRRAKSHRRFGFPPYYAKLNRLRNKKRYRIIVFSSTLGMTLFLTMTTFSAGMVNYLNMTLNTCKIELRYTDDITVQAFTEDVAALDATGDYAAAAGMAYTGIFLMGEGSNFEDGLTPEAREMVQTEYVENLRYAMLYYVDAHTYQTYLQPVTGISFDKWVQRGEAVVVADMMVEIDTDYRIETRQTRLFDDDVDFHLHAIRYNWNNDTHSQQTIPLDIYLTHTIGSDELPAMFDSSSLQIFLPLTEENASEQDLAIFLQPHEDHYEAAIASLQEKAEQDSRIRGLWDQYGEGKALRGLMKVGMEAVLYVLAIFFFINLFNIMNTIHTSIMNRQCELAMVRAVGMTRRQMRASVILEAVRYIVVAIILGTVVSAVLVWLLNYGMGIFTAVWILYLLLFALAALILGGAMSVLAVFPSLRTAERSEVMEVIREIS